MAIRYRTKHYLVLIDGAFVDDGVWFVDLAVILDPPSDPEACEALLKEVKRAILLGIVEETRRGKALGARTIRVRQAPDVRRSPLQTMGDL